MGRRHGTGKEGKGRGVDIIKRKDVEEREDTSQVHPEAPLGSIGMGGRRRGTITGGHVI